MAWRVEKVEDQVPVVERHHRTCDRNPPVLLDLHPVRARAPTLTPRLDVASKVNGAAFKQQSFG